MTTVDTANSVTCPNCGSEIKTYGTPAPVHHCRACRTHTWSDREEWAKWRRTAFTDHVDEATRAVRVSNAASDYATADEADEALREMRALRLAWHRKARELTDAAGDLAPRSRDTVRVRTERWLAMSDAEQKVVMDIGRARDMYRGADRLVKALSAGELCWVEDYRREGWEAAPTATAILERWSDAIDAARKAAEDEFIRKVKATPIDDAAWEGECKRRRRLDAYFD